MRQDPDVILVGEMRDQETVAAALSAAETGHLVLSTLHTIDATETVNRIVDFFPPHLEVMVANGRIQQCIIDPNKAGEMHEIIADGEYYGMQTFDQSLVKLFEAGKVDMRGAMMAASNPSDLKIMLQQKGLVGTTTR
jgi:twitching motility protein PilT